MKVRLMTISKGEIWLANLNPQKRVNEVGKTRPVLVIQNDVLNHSDYPSTIIMPLTTSLVNEAEPLRFRIVKRDKLEQDSDLLVSHIRAIDNIRFIEKLTMVSTQEMEIIKTLLTEIL